MGWRPPTRVLRLAPVAVTGRRARCGRGVCSLFALACCPAPARALPSLSLQLATTGAAPLYATHAGDARLFIVERDGRILVSVPGTGVLPMPFLDIRDLVDDSADGGLYTIAFHPRYATTGTFFVSYTATSAPLRSVIARYRVSAADPNVADPPSGRVVVTLEQPHASHNNGQIAFGPDGFLYVGFGDGGGGGGPGCRAQLGDGLFGKILRLDVDGNLDGAPYYGVPRDNPYADPADCVRDEIWTRGFRNPWRFSFDRALGDLFIGDVGQAAREEVSIEPAGTPGGRNYGWKVHEGTACFAPDPVAAECPVGTPPCGAPGYTAPLFEYVNQGFGVGNDCSVIGGYRYRGARADARGSYLFGDYCSGHVWALEETSPGVWARTLLATAGFGLTSFGEDRDGELYVTVGANVFRLVFSGPGAAPVCGDGVVAGAETCDDGNMAGGDGCSVACALEPGATCTGEPSVCRLPADPYVVYTVRASNRPDLPRHGRFPTPGWNLQVDDATLAAGAADDPENHQVRRACGLALPARLDAGPAPATPALHYVGYQLAAAPEGARAFDTMAGRYPRPVKHQPRTWRVANRFGTLRVRSKRTRLLWVPAAMRPGVPPAAPGDATHYQCYDVKATTDVTGQTPDAGGGLGRFRRDLQTFASDTFLAADCALDAGGQPSFAGTAVQGTCLFTVRRPRFLCAAAGTRAVGGTPPRTTMAPIAGSTPARAGTLLCYRVRLATRLLSQELLDTGLLAGRVPPAMLKDRVAQRKHVRREIARGTAPFTMPGNGFPAPLQVDTRRMSYLCIPTVVDDVSG